MDGKEGNRRLIQQLIDLIGQFDQAQFTRPLKAFNGASVGQHTRHIYDFYQCFLDGIARHNIDYAERERNLHIEQDPVYAVSVFTEINGKIGTLKSGKIDVLSDFSPEHDSERVRVGSSIDRELMFLHDHAVHHLAIIKIGLRLAFPGLIFENDLGVAPSTIRHRQTR